MMEVPGVTVNLVRLGEDFKQANPTVAIKNHYLPPSQWEQEARRVSEAPSPEPKKGAPAAKGAKAPSKPPATAQTAQPSETAPAEVVPIVTPTIVAPKEKLYQQALLARQQAIENFVSLSTHFSEMAAEKIAKLEKSEKTWSESWQQAMSILRAK
jgi:hypothetical protein